MAAKGKRRYEEKPRRRKSKGRKGKTEAQRRYGR